MFCIYHSRDMDGYCSGAVVKRKYPEATLIGYDYGQPFPLTVEEVFGHDIIMIDVSMPMEKMFELATMCSHLTWIDHHISAINDYYNFLQKVTGRPNITAVLENGISACEGAWKNFFPDQPMPEAVRLLGEYDTWRNADKGRWDNRIMPFQYGMRMVCSSAETFPHDVIGHGGMAGVNKMIDNGELILAYQKTQNERACKNAFEIEFEGLRAIVLNNAGSNSQVFDSVYNPLKHDIMIPFSFTGKQWNFSIYTTNDSIDCSAIAKAKGGGGHRQAAGFQLPELPNEFKIHVANGI